MRRAFGLAAVALLCALALTACPSVPAPAPTATPAPATPPPTDTAVPPTAAPTVAPAATVVPQPTVKADQLPDGWRREANDQVSIAIPPGWRVIKLNDADARPGYESYRQLDREMASIVGGPERLLEAVLWAFGPGGGDFADNLNVRRSPSGPQILTDLQPVLDGLLPEYAKMGMQVTSAEAGLRVNGLPAARVTYSWPMRSADGQTRELRGRQVIVGTDSDLWFLTFTTTPDREGQMAPLFEMSATSFQPAQSFEPK